MNHRCPVCGYSELSEPPENYEICPCCGTEFGYDDRLSTHAELRRHWLLTGGPWFDFGTPIPANWNPYEQVLRAGYGYRLASGAGTEEERLPPPVQEGPPEVQTCYILVGQPVA